LPRLSNVVVPRGENSRTVSDAGSENGEFGADGGEAATDVLADPALSVDRFSVIVALTVAIAENPWLTGSPTPSRYHLNWIPKHCRWK